MAEIILNPGNEAIILNAAEVDEVIIPSGTRGENDLLFNFQTVDRVDISAIPDTVEDILENAVEIPNQNAVRLSGTFGQLTLVGIVRSQLTAEIFIKTPPEVNDDTITTIAGEAISIPVLENDVAANGDLEITGFSATTANGGTIALDDNDTPDDSSDDFLVYSPAEEFTGTDSFTYTVSNGLNATGTGTVTVSVIPENQPPIAEDDTALTTEGIAATIAVLDNDSDPDNGPEALTISDFQDVAENGAIALDGLTLVYTPDEGFAGTDTFSYTVSDGLATDIATVTVTVEANEPPIAVDDTALTTEGIAATIAVLDNDSDPDGDEISLVDFAATTENDGTITIDNGGSPFDLTDDALVYEAAVDFTGTDSFTYTISDGLETDTATVTVTVGPGNQAPIAVDDTAETTAGNSVTIGVLDNDSDPDGDAISLPQGSFARTTANGGTITRDNNGTPSDGTDDALLYTASAEFTGTDSFTYTISDGELTDTATVTVTVDRGNQAPIAIEDEAIAIEGVPETIAVLDNDFDPDGDVLEILGVPVTTELGATIGIDDNGTPDDTGDDVLVYDLAEVSDTVTDSFTYTISDGSLTDTATVTVTVVPGNDPPVAVEDTIVATQGIPAPIEVLDNDFDPNGDDISLVGWQTTTAAGGTVTLDRNGTFRDTTDDFLGYTSAATFTGTDSFTYSISDGELTSTATVTVTVEPGGPIVPPIAEDDTAATTVDIPATIAVLANDSDPDGNVPLSITDVGDPENGTASIDGDQIIYTPDASFTGINSFTYTMADAQGNTDTAEVTVTVAPEENVAPIAVDDPAMTDEDVAVTIAVLANDSDVNGDVLSVTGVGEGADGSASISGDEVIYTPDADFFGTDSFTYTITDGELTDSATVTVTVDPVNDAPIAVDDTGTATEGTPETIAVLDNDSDPEDDPLEITELSETTAGGMVTISEGTVIYTPPEEIDATVTDSFTYTISDGQGGTDSATVTVTVTPDNLPPIATADATVTTEGVAATIAVLDNDSDPDNGPEALSITGVSETAAGGTVTLDGDLAIYTPGEVDALVTDSFTYTISDGELTDTATVTVTVEPNEAPIAVDDVTVTTEGIAATIAVLDNDSDPDNGPEALSITGVSETAAGGTVTLDGDLAIYTPAAVDALVTDSFTYTISDGELTDTATVTVTVEPNEAPIAVDDVTVTTEGIAATIAVLDNDSDPDNGPEALSITGVSGTAAGGTVTLDGDLAIYTPGEVDALVTDSFTYTISDGELTDTATVTVTVEPDNQLPIAVDDEATTTQNIPVTIAVLDNDSDPDNDPLEITAVTDPANGTTAIDDNGTPDDTTDDRIVYTPDAGFNGTDDFTYSISDGQGGTASATVTVTVEANDAPIAVDDAGIVAAGATINIAVLENDSDPDGDVLTIDGATEPTDGTASIDGALVSYTPDAGFTGDDSFTYTISDTAGETATAVVNISVEPGGDVTGTDGDDQIVGNDLLSADPGGTRERIEGLAGDDIITGARGADILLGGPGADEFVYQSLADSGADPAAPTEGVDDIRDFSLVEGDTIRLNFEVAPGTPVTIDDVQINLDFIANGVAIIALSGTNDGDFLPANFAIRLSNLDPTTSPEEIENALLF